MRLRCPHCGERDAEEFATLGSTGGQRPEAGGDALARFHDYLHLRNNPAGPNLEYWYHAAGCRSWLLVRRDTLTHEIFSVEMASS
jgi:heterotetrameric sarcosine oxidase delta subunit